MKKKKQKVIVGLSGGVDSSVALLLLKKGGYEPIGVSLRYSVWGDKKNILRENICCSKESLRIAKGICQKLRVPYHIIDAKINFKERVIGYYLSILKEGRTPNPCLVCNRFVKFQELLNFAQERGIKWIATGHYARIRKNPQTGLYELLKGKDPDKDQSYFLCLLTQKQLSRIIFPLGEYTKKKVYQIAFQEGFDFFRKRKQSQDLCFVARQSAPYFLRKELGLQPGEIVDKQGRILGRHQGLYFYTIGQRRGIGLSGGPWWVIDKDREKNQLVVTNQENDPLLFRKEVILSKVHFVSGKFPSKRIIKVEAKTRFTQPLASGKLALSLAKNNGKNQKKSPSSKPEEDLLVKLIFDKPQKAVTSGQWAVFYQKDVCLGGGEIE